MIFFHWYGVYFQAMAKILSAALDHPLDKKEIRRLVQDTVVGETAFFLLSALEEGRWQLLTKEGTTPIKNKPVLPLTTLEKQWLNAIALDKRMHLFCEAPYEDPQVEPLFLPEDICVFDRYQDGDPYEDETYRAHFRLILSAIKEGKQLEITMKNRTGSLMRRRVQPHHLEYSPKDDKFRLITTGNRFGNTINLSRILTCQWSKTPLVTAGEPEEKQDAKRKLVCLLHDKRRALERVLLHFSHLEKEVEQLDDVSYRLTLWYDREDETELVIRILSFGPLVQVEEPEDMVEEIKRRLSLQKRLGRSRSV